MQHCGIECKSLKIVSKRRRVYKTKSSWLNLVRNCVCVEAPYVRWVLHTEADKAPVQSQQLVGGDKIQYRLRDKGEDPFIPTQNDRKILVVGNVLHLCCHNAPRLLEENLIRPAWVDAGKFLGQAVVLSHPQCVHDSQLGLLVDAGVTYRNVVNLSDSYGILEFQLVVLL